MNKLGIESYGITTTNLEEVFLSIPKVKTSDCVLTGRKELEVALHVDDLRADNNQSIEIESQKVERPTHLIWIHSHALFRKRF